MNSVSGYVKHYVLHIKTIDRTLRVGDFPKMENSLYMWFIQERSKHTPISGEILKAYAIEFYQTITKKV